MRVEWLRKNRQEVAARSVILHQGSYCGSTVDQQGINTGGMSTRGRSLPWGLRGVDFRPLLRPWDYEIRNQRPQISIIPNGEGLG